MAEENMDLSGAVEMLSQMLQEGDGGNQLQNILGMFSGGEKGEISGQQSGGLDMENIEMMMKISQAMTIMNRQKDDNHTRLLMALRPFLKPARQEKVDHAMKFLKLGGVLNIIREVQGE